MSDGFISAFSAGPKVLLTAEGRTPHVGAAGLNTGHCGKAAATAYRLAGR
jgi:hypothetical protein